MGSVKDVLAGLPSAAKRGSSNASGDDVMSNPDYLRKSQSLITEALQKGFDVLQLENGDVVVTGTKTIVTQYGWDEKKGKMVKVTARGGKRGKKDSDLED